MSISKRGKKDQGLELNEEIEKELVEITNSSDPHIVEIQRKVANVFDIFDQSGKRIIDIREIGNLVRALDLYPTEGDVNEIIQIVEETTSKGQVKFERFVPYMTKIILNGVKYKPTDCEQITTALHVLDRTREGYLEPAKIKEILMREGEPFTGDEINEMMNAAVGTNGRMNIEDYLAKLCYSAGIAGIQSLQHQQQQSQVQIKNEAEAENDDEK